MKITVLGPINMPRIVIHIRNAGIADPIKFLEIANNTSNVVLLMKQCCCKYNINMQGALPTPHEQGKLDMHGPGSLACMPPNHPRAFLQASRLLTLSL